MDAAWALPVNTLLLIVLAVVQYRTNRQVNVTKRIAKESHNELADALNGQAEAANVRKFRLRDDPLATDTLRPEKVPD